jgi:hypothetical protein
MSIAGMTISRMTTGKLRLSKMLFNYLIPKIEILIFQG